MTIKKKTIGTSSLAKPSLDAFLHYSNLFIEEGQYSNNGPCVKLLEKRLARFHKCKYCITFSNGFWGLVLALDCLKLANRNEVLIPSLTYRRMADLVTWAELKPVYYDIDPNTLTAKKQHIEEKLTQNTAAVLGVQPIVNCFPTYAIKQLCENHKIPFIMDSVESAYEMNNGSKVGAQATVEVFSMHASKLLNGGEGGYATTNEEYIYKKLSSLRGFGFEGPDNLKYENGINAKLNEVHAALALANLDSIESLVRHNRRIYQSYKNELFDIPGIELIYFNESEKTSYKNIVVKINTSFPLSRDQLEEYLNQNSFLARSYYSPPLHIQNKTDVKLPNTESCSLNHLILPSGYQCTTKDVADICKLIRSLK
ncbi:aminotransferase class I/II-fold pyridoxal phosphate-dependent enzyme [Synechococcus sp. UW179A]|uniref:aminotransferase class I/II-fold pyridoxal phosphate-dependent enzyme n=1 Tax=Synechococcus sp. UW179A TaxID=2575510 RepID=UPI000E0EBA75|nr:aminotransferase class I/II-fold pyridoxal phosphate-dependent enzyme [Synechococcus sp. UW179A]